MKNKSAFWNGGHSCKIEVHVRLWNVIAHGRDKHMNSSFHEFDRDPLSRTLMAGGMITSSLRNKAVCILLPLAEPFRSKVLEGEILVVAQTEKGTCHTTHRYALRKLSKPSQIGLNNLLE